MRDNAALPVLESILKPEHFQDARHRMIFASMLAMGMAGRQIDFVTLKDELGDGLDGAGGIEYLASLVDGLPRITNVDGWARIIRSKAKARAFLALLERGIKDSGGLEDIDALVDAHQSACGRLQETNDHGMRSMADVLPLAFQNLNTFVHSDTGITGIPTGLDTLDKLTGGMKSGQLWIIAARPARGKSAMCAQIAVHAALMGKRVLIFGMEMPAPQLAERMLLAEAGVNRWRLRDQHPGDWSSVYTAEEKLKGVPIWFDGREAPTLAQIRASARIHQQRYGLDLVVVDYLQRCTVNSKLERWEAVGEVARGLKGLARSLNVPVVAACQTNAESEERKPTLADLAQARQVIAAEADLIGLLHPDNLQEYRTQTSSQVNLLIEKHRDGATMVIPLTFERSCTRFHSIKMGDM